MWKKISPKLAQKKTNLCTKNSIVEFQAQDVPSFVSIRAILAELEPLENLYKLYNLDNLYNGYFDPILQNRAQSYQ